MCIFAICSKSEKITVYVRDMANVIDCVVKNLDASGSGTPEEKSGIDSSGSNNGDRRKRCETFLRITAVAATIALVWGLIVMSVISPYFPRDYKVHAPSARDMDETKIFL